MGYHVNKSKGYVLSYRSQMDDPDYLSEPFTRSGAWEDLIKLAAWEDTFVRIRRIKVPYKRGQVAWSKAALHKRWKWSMNKLRHWLQECIEDEKIRVYENNLTTIITILNYNIYQTPLKNLSPLKNSKNFAKKKVTKKRQKVRQKNSGKSSPNSVSPKLKVEKGTAKTTTAGMAVLPKTKNTSLKKGTAKIPKQVTQKVRQKNDEEPQQQSISLNGTSVKGMAKVSAAGMANIPAAGMAEGMAAGTHIKKLKKLKKLKNIGNKENAKIPVEKTHSGETAAGETAAKKSNGQMDQKNCRFLLPKMLKKWKDQNPGYPADISLDYAPLLKIAKFIAGQEGLNDPIGSQQPEILSIWDKMIPPISQHRFYGNNGPLITVAAHIQLFYNKNSKNEERSANSANANSNGSPQPAGSKSKDRIDAIRDWSSDGSAESS